MQVAMSRAIWTIDAKYDKADLQSIVKDNRKHLSTDQQNKLLQPFMKYEPLFDSSTLGDGKTKLVSFQLKEGSKPYHGRAFPVSKIHKEVLIRERDRLCELEVLEQQQEFEWASPTKEK